MRSLLFCEGSLFVLSVGMVQSQRPQGRANVVFPVLLLLFGELCRPNAFAMVLCIVHWDRDKYPWTISSRQPGEEHQKRCHKVRSEKIASRKLSEKNFVWCLFHFTTLSSTFFCCGVVDLLIFGPREAQ